MEQKDLWSGIRPDRMRFVSLVPERLRRSSAVPVMELMFRLEIWHAYRSDIRKDIAIANVYRSVINTILKVKAGETPTEEDLDFPGVDTGVSGVKFYYAVIESAQNNSKWVELD